MWREISQLEPRPLAVIGWLDARLPAGLTVSGQATQGTFPQLTHWSATQSVASLCLLLTLTCEAC